MFIIPIIIIILILTVISQISPEGKIPEQEMEKEERDKQVPVTKSVVSNICKYTRYITYYSNKYNVDPFLTSTVIAIESAGNPKAFRLEKQINDASRGLMQILFKTAKSIGFSGSEDLLFDPETNIKFGTLYLAKSLRNENEDFFNALRGYNGGLGWRKGSEKAKKMTLAYANKGIGTYNYLKEVLKF